MAMTPRFDERQIVVVAYPEVQVLDVVGPGEVFAIANRYLTPAQRPYRVEIAARRAGEIATSGGMRIIATTTLASLRRSRPDTVLVAGGTGVRAAAADEDLVREICAIAKRASRTASVCTGSFLLARAGLLDGRRATTHWSQCELFAELFPSTVVEPDAIYVRDGAVYTSAGITAGIDLALAFVEDDHGADLARTVARQLVVFLQRPGGQAQFSAHMEQRLADRGSVRGVQAWIADHLANDLCVARLAEQASMSTRNFARVFRRDVGVTPGEYVEAARVEAAQRLLESTTASVGEVARSCGFGSGETLHRVFKKRTGVTPIEFRARFRRSC
jgi:transcriptional regulator GlxA family with amidase domain